MRFPFALSEIFWNSLLEASKTDHQKHRPGKTFFQTVLFCVIRRSDAVSAAGVRYGVWIKRKPESDLSLAAPAVSMSGATDREIAGEPARKDLNRGEREAGGTPCQSDLEEGCQRPHSLGSSPSKIRSSKFPLPPDQTGWNVIAMPPAQSVFHNTFRFIGYIRTGGTIAAGRWGWALCFSVGPGYFSMPEVRCKLYNMPKQNKIDSPEPTTAQGA